MEGLRRILKTRGITQIWLCKKVGVHPMTVSMWFRAAKDQGGKEVMRIPRQKTLRKICRVLKVEMTDLF